MSRGDSADKGEEVRVPGSYQTTGGANGSYAFEGVKIGGKEGGGRLGRKVFDFCLLQAHDAGPGKRKIGPHNITFLRVAQPTSVPRSDRKRNKAIHLGTIAGTVATQPKRTAANDKGLVPERETQGGRTQQRGGYKPKPQHMSLGFWLQQICLVSGGTSNASRASSVTA
jgi:hypothetical protein